MNYLPDTDTCIYIINQHSKMVRRAEPDDCAISVIGLGELKRCKRRTNEAVTHYAGDLRGTCLDQLRDHVAGFLGGEVRSPVQATHPAARQGRSNTSIIEESLRLRGIQGQASARDLVAQARKSAQLDPDPALELAVEDTRAARKR